MPANIWTFLKHPTTPETARLHFSSTPALSYYLSKLYINSSDPIDYLLIHQGKSSESFDSVTTTTQFGNSSAKARQKLPEQEFAMNPQVAEPNQQSRQLGSRIVMEALSSKEHTLICFVFPNLTELDHQDVQRILPNANHGRHVVSRQTCHLSTMKVHQMRNRDKPKIGLRIHVIHAKSRQGLFEQHVVHGFTQESRINKTILPIPFRITSLSKIPKNLHHEIGFFTTEENKFRVPRMEKVKTTQQPLPQHLVGIPEVLDRIHTNLVLAQLHLKHSSDRVKAPRMSFLVSRTNLRMQSIQYHCQKLFDATTHSVFDDRKLWQREELKHAKYEWNRTYNSVVSNHPTFHQTVKTRMTSINDFHKCSRSGRISSLIDDYRSRRSDRFTKRPGLIRDCTRDPTHENYPFEGVSSRQKRIRPLVVTNHLVSINCLYFGSKVSNGFDTWIRIGSERR